MALDKEDQMSGGKTAAGSKSASKSTGSNSGASKGSSGGGKMGSGSSQTGGMKSGGAKSSTGGKMGAASSQTGAKGSKSAGMGSANAATGPKGYGGKDTSGTGLGSKIGGGILGGGGKMGASSSQTGGILGGVSRPGSYAGPKGATALNQAARSASARASGYPNIPSVGVTPAELDLATRVALAESSSIKNRFGRPQTAALQAVADVMRNRALSVQYPNTLGGVVTQPKQFSAYNPDARKTTLSAYGPKNPNYAATRGTIASIMAGETAPVVGNSLNYGNLASINNPGSISNPKQRPSAASQTAFNSMPVDRSFVSATNPAMQHSFGTIGQPSDVNLGAGSPGPGLAAAVSSPGSFPGRPSPSQNFNSMVAGRPDPTQQFNSQIAARPDPQRDFASAIAGRPAPQQQFNSMMAARPEQVGMGFPAAMRSDFPGRPAPQAGFASQIAGRPDPQQGFMSQMAGKPDLPGAFPGAQVTDNFPGRPGMPQGFQSQIAGRPGLPNTFNSQVAGRPEFPGALPAAQSSPVQEAQARPSGPGILSGLSQAVAPQNPPRSFADIPQGGLLAAQDDGSFMNRMMGATGVPAPGNDLRDVRGGQQPVEWTGNEPPQMVAQMQQHVEQVLASYFGTPQTQFPQYASGQWADLPAGSAA